jgi:DNA-binding NarL/FixJ family response regulator
VNSANSAGSVLNILLADDHEVMRLAMRHALRSLAAEIRWHEAADAAQVEALLADGVDFDLALVDFNMPGSSGAATIARWRNEHPAVPLVVISATEDGALIRELIGLGVAGFLPKSDAAAVMLQAMRLVLAGGTYAPLRFLAEPAPEGAQTVAAHNGLGLTPRQTDVLGLLARGLPNKSIARELGLSEATVKVHLLAIFRVLQARNRTEAVVAAQGRLGQVGPGSGAGERAGGDSGASARS